MSEELIHKAEVFELIGCSMEVLNTIRHGLLEKPYENALVVEMKLRGIPFSQQQRFPVNYKGTVVGEYIPDLIAYNKVIVDAKTIPKIGNHERTQMLNYLSITKLRVGLIINFRKPTLEWERIVL